MKVSITILLLAVWFLFLLFFPEQVKSFVIYSIAGWQVGKWASHLASKADQ